MISPFSILTAAISTIFGITPLSIRPVVSKSNTVNVPSRRSGQIYGISSNSDNGLSSLSSKCCFGSGT